MLSRSGKLDFLPWPIAVYGFEQCVCSTYTGDFEDIEKMDKLIGELNAKTGWDVPIHVDAASGGKQHACCKLGRLVLRSPAVRSLGHAQGF